MNVARCSMVAVLVALPVLAVAQDGAAKPKHVTLETLTSMVRLGDPQISPDGKSVVVVVSRQNMKDDRTDGELVLVDVATKAQRVLTQGKMHVGFPRWSPGGERLAYIATGSAGEGDKEKKPEIFVLPMAGGESLQLTHAEGGVQQFAW